MAAHRMCCFYIVSVLLGGKLSLGLLDDASNSDVNVVKLRLSEEKSKRLLIQNDVESLMVKTEEMQRMLLDLQKTCDVTSSENPSKKSPVFFNAKLTSHMTLDALHVIVFDKVLDNVGGGYSQATGIFRAVAPGLYQFSLSILSQSKDKYAHIQLMKNNGEIGRVYAGDIVAAYGQMGSVTVVTQLAEGDEVYARELPSNTGYVYGNDYSSFSGVLLSNV